MRHEYQKSGFTNASYLVSRVSRERVLLMCQVAIKGHVGSSVKT